jgi:hypothetical protein
MRTPRRLFAVSLLMDDLQVDDLSNPSGIIQNHDRAVMRRLPFLGSAAHRQGGFIALRPVVPGKQARLGRSVLK